MNTVKGSGRDLLQGSISTFTWRCSGRWR